MKRAFDIVVSLSLLIVLWPLLMLVAILILVIDGTPVLFRQLRVGKGGVDFCILKFRTMAKRSQTVEGSFEPGDASRVTAIGRFLRKTKIDELPQLWNVLSGDMSLVGPRPEIRKWVDVFPERWEVIHTVLPGVTDYASIKYRNEEQTLNVADDPEQKYREEILPRKLTAYENYVENHSFGGDLVILFKTIIAVMRK